MRWTKVGTSALLLSICAALGGNGWAAEPSAEELTKQLQEQQAKNEALKQQIEKLEALLKTDVCADPAATEAALNEASAAGAPVVPR